MYQMLVCNICDGFIPIEISICPNCGSKFKYPSSKGRAVQKIVSSIATLSIGMTLMACYGQPAREVDDKLLVSLLARENLHSIKAIITAPNDLGTLTIELGSNKFILAEGEKSKPFNLYSNGNYYRIKDSMNHVIFENNKFFFEENCKDGIIVKSDSKIDFNKEDICYHLNGILGKLETINCSELDEI
ncbi:hypothetical protein P3G55_14185 [Leptospira sp. 96542]|nr:hypothetical protein [Leptospira sp. 96542]